MREWPRGDPGGPWWGVVGRNVHEEGVQEVVEQQKQATGYKSEMRVKMGKVADDKFGVKIGLDGGDIEVYAAQCGNGLAEIQVGLGGELSDAMFMRKACNKDEECGEGITCKGLDTFLFETPIYSVDFMGGFMWGGNFTKGFVGGCPILSTTINQMDFSTAEAECLGQKRWANDMGTTFKKHTSNQVLKDKRITWCHATKNTVVEKIFDKHATATTLDLSSATPLSTPPFKIPEGNKKKHSTASLQEEL
eukprot:TRINITY_DN7124_c0_g1_i1.p1 TRINITY_DN7124_c0_g1~~TRINITY_DN7124_c0_g1_i1.p1  ORF type:complete len:249 (-),score=69.08 TRINITY_DN7124_c0_g1_i1:80-826(-)